MAKIKKGLASIILILIIFTMVSCSTTVRVSSLVPSKVNMSNYRNIAISSTKPYEYSKGNNVIQLIWNLTTELIWGSNVRFSSVVLSGVPSDFSSKVANYANTSLQGTLSSNDYYTITNSEVTDAILKIGQYDGSARKMFLEKNIDAVVSSQINYLDCDERYSLGDLKKVEQFDVNGNLLLDGSGNQVYRYYKDIYLNQKVTVGFTYAVTDVKTNFIITSKSLTDSRSREVWIGTVEMESDRANAKVVAYTERSFWDTDISTLYKKVLDGFQSEIKAQLVPHRVYSSETLMKNKPKNEAVKEAYSMVSKGNIKPALEIFENEWNYTRHVPSGYNAALLYISLGDSEKALELLKEVGSYSGNSEVFSTQRRLEETIRQNQLALDQMKTMEEKTDDTEVSVFKTVWMD